MDGSAVFELAQRLLQQREGTVAGGNAHNLLHSSGIGLVLHATHRRCAQAGSATVESCCLKAQVFVQPRRD